jgi:hypothetical protein
MSDREAFETVASEIAEWELAAQQLPLPELYAMATTCQNGLAESLNAFNDICTSYSDGQEPSTEVVRALGQVTRRATAMAIFTLGIAHRVHLTAHQN